MEELERATPVLVLSQGEGVATAIRGIAASAATDIAVTTGSPDEVQGGQVDPGEYSLAVVVQSSSQAHLDTIARLDARADDVPVVGVIDTGDGQAHVDALAAGAAKVLPRTAFERSPETVADLLVDAAAEPRDQYAAVEQVMAETAAPASFHDPSTGELVEVSRGLAEALGYPDRPSLLDDGVEAVLPAGESEGESLREKLGDIPDDLSITSTEVERSLPDGRTRLFHVVTMPASIGDDPLVLCLWRDVTERRELRRTYRDVFEGVSDGLVVHDPETGEIEDVNQRFCEQVGYGSEELVGETVDVVTAPGDEYSYERARERIRQADTDGPQLFEWRNQHADGQTFPVEVHLSVVELQGAEFVLASVRDISERKRREREYEQVFDGVTDAITVHDPWEEELVDANESLCSLLGYDRAAVLDMGIDEFSYGDEGFTADRAYEIQREVAESGEPETVEWKVETAAGSVRTLETKLTPATIGGEKRVLVISRDVTERRRREREYEQMFNKVNDAISVHDPETGEILQVNETYTREFGYDQETSRDLGVEGLSVPEEGYTGERSRTIIQEVAETGESITVEWLVENADGERRWYEVNTTPARIGGELRVLGISRDVTERKRREREYEQIFDGVTDAITVHDPETGTIVDVNQAMCELVGYDRETILEQGIAGVSVTEEGYTKEQAREVIHRVMDSGESETLEWKVETASSEHRWLEVKATPAVIGGEDRYIGMTRDVTERRRREREYEQIFDGVTDAIAVHDPDTGEILQVNETYSDLLGYDRETIVDLGIDGISDTETGYTRERGEALIDRVVAGESVDPFEWAVQRADGERRWFEVVLTTARIGGETRVLGIARDVTERREREQQIAEEREKYSTLVEQSTDGVAVVQDESYTFVNQQFTEITGYDRTELLSMSFEEVFAPSHRDLVVERFRKRVDGESPPRQYDVEVETAAGNRRTLELAVSRITHEGDPATLANFRDVTERRAREEELRRSEQQFRQIAEAVDEVIHLADPDFAETHYISPAYEDIWGRPVEELYEDPLSFEETIHPADREEFMAFLDGLDDWPDPGETETADYSYEYRVERADGSVRWIDGRVYPIRDESGDVSRVVSVSRDVTERQRRRQTLESFQEATAELTTAESAVAACETAVSAAAEVFGLDSVAVHLFDEGTGTLSPVAATADLGPTDALPAWSAENRVPWEVFVDELPDRVAVGDAPALAVAGVDEEGSALVMPLSGHGVLTVWMADDGVDVETAHLIAAVLEGGLNHLVGQRRLESQREELAVQTERAEQLERIAELTRQVEVAITEQSTRVGVERAVCEGLVGIGPFAAAWTAETEPGSDRLTPRTTAGITEEDAERTVTAAGSRDGYPHPALEAWETDEVVVETDLVGTTGENWRRDLLRRGIQAVCAIPLSYEGITHGVLVIHATDPTAFEGPGRESIDQLGTSIGYAITAIERRRALESDETLELEFRDDDDCSVPFARLATETGCQVRHDRTVRRRDGSLSVVYTVIGDVPDDVETVADRVLPGETEVLNDSVDQAVVERRGTSWFGSIISDYGGVLRRGHATPELATFVVELPTEANTRRFVDRLSETIPGIEMVAQRQHQPTDSTPGEVGARLEQRLSDRQQQALEAAYEMGYFDWPREHSGQEVADEMGISQPTLNKHIRLAERKVFDLLLDSDDSGSGAV
ncbi:PAS domain S-box protein [Haloarchaeobius amylolyticus]|uniref:PAS domain S-box protein n=1 Tax=Haloarchaeobius amylolyticus TaxID=1198296 RepID=UPI00226F149D|nr:PAS domain S-box protein [Haloarchaeobius amylolyticus]